MYEMKRWAEFGKKQIVQMRGKKKKMRKACSLQELSVLNEAEREEGELVHPGGHRAAEVPRC